ncbi:MAG: MBL fold metallo-hydrolase [Planctomycetes bacterium]|nr:MBL fold metallo-hydrolase [Planctomycetota bacterium]
MIQEINECKVGPDEMAVWWLGQMGFVVKAGNHIIYLDPYLSPNPRRQVAPFFKPEEVTNATLICGTHDHSDHIDRPVWPALAEASPGAKFLVPELFRERLSEELSIPAERFVGMDDGAAIEIGGARITGVASAHELLDMDPDSGRHPYLGFVFEVGGCTFYHSGDSCKYEGLETKLKAWRFDLLCLPINGRDAERLARNCIGNMTYQEAVDLAGALMPGMIIPGHWDMFSGNPGDPDAFTQYANVKYPKLNVCVPKQGECVRVSCGK